MGLRSIRFEESGSPHITYGALYCSTSMTVLPFIFRSEQDAIDFLDVHGDIRRLDAPERQKLFDAWEDEWRRAAEQPVAARHPRALCELSDGVDDTNVARTAPEK